MKTKSDVLWAVQNFLRDAATVSNNIAFGAIRKWTVIYTIWLRDVRLYSVDRPLPAASEFDDADLVAAAKAALDAIADRHAKRFL